MRSVFPSAFGTRLVRISMDPFGQFISQMPQPVQRLQLPKTNDDARPRVVYLAACVSRAMGPTASDSEQMPLLDKTRALLEKGGFQVVFPDELDNLCCGQPFASKGYTEQQMELIAAYFSKQKAK